MVLQRLLYPLSAIFNLKYIHQLQLPILPTIRLHIQWELYNFTGNFTRMFRTLLYLLYVVINDEVQLQKTISFPAH